jgi:phosphomannomutase
MSDIFLFDVDGTLTVAKQKMDKSFQKDFLTWMNDKEVYIVSGGTFERILNQVGTDVLNETSGVFACMGNVFLQRVELVNDSGYSEWQIVYENKFEYPKNLVRRLESIVAKSDFPVKTGRHYEERVGMINYSIVGRNATQEQRKQYEDWDAERQERKQIVEKLRKKFDALDFVIGGAVSMDIFNKGNDKSQIIDKYFNEALEHNSIHFIGDRIPSPGNDHTLAEALRAHPNGAAYEVETWEDTAKLLKSSPFV